MRTLAVKEVLTVQDYVNDNASLRPPGAGDRGLLGAAGALLLALAGFFLWQDLSLEPAWLVTVAAALGLGASLAPRRPGLGRAGVLLLVLSGAGGGLWYALTRGAALLPGLGLAALGTVLAAAVSYPRARLGERSIAPLVHLGMAVTVLAATWAFYFHFFTLGVAAVSVSRRLVLTLLWVALGVALVLLGGRQREGTLRAAGYLFVAAAVSKAVGYDTTHLAGALRVLLLGGAGAALLGGAALSRGRR